MSDSMTLADPISEFVTAAQALEGAQRFSDGELEVVYSLAYNLYTQGKYPEAQGYFSFLTVYRPSNVRYLKGLGASQFMARQYDAAAATYSFVVLLEPNDAEALCMNGHALLLSGEREDARAFLQQAVAVPTRQGDFAGKAKALLDLLDA